MGLIGTKVKLGLDLVATKCKRRIPQQTQVNIHLLIMWRPCRCSTIAEVWLCGLG